ncbi:MAG: sugar kinase [Phycisphaerae bacterium]|nr:sugar kinase [Phycisphaerae bacterium]
MSLVVTGTIGIDSIETPTGKVESVMGGSCSYFAAAASHLCPVRIVGAVGGDWPEAHKEVLESFSNIDQGGLEHRADSRTFAWGGKYMENLSERETLFTELGVLEEEPPPVPDAYADSSFIFLANTHPAVQLNMLEQFPNRRLAVVDTMNLWIDTARDQLLDLFQKVDGVIVNDLEATELTGITNAISAGHAILDMGPGFVVIKKGEHGAVLVHEDGLAVIPAYPAAHEQVVDPTGAGDSFAGGMMGHVASIDQVDLPALQQGLAWGTVMASFTIESFGLEGLQRTNETMITERLEQFRCLARIG